MRGDVTDAGQTTNDDDEQVKIELLSQWKLEAESRNFLCSKITDSFSKKVDKKLI